MIRSFRGVKAHIDHLIKYDVENGERDDAPFNHSRPMELCIVNETQIVLVHIVFEEEEKHCKDGNIWDERGEDHGNLKSCESIGHMVTQIIRVCINKGPLVLFSCLFRVMTHLTDGPHEHVGDVQHPKTHGKEH